MTPGAGARGTSTITRFTIELCETAAWCRNRAIECHTPPKSCLCLLLCVVAASHYHTGDYTVLPCPGERPCSWGKAAQLKGRKGRCGVLLTPARERRGSCTALTVAPACLQFANQDARRARKDSAPGFPASRLGSGRSWGMHSAEGISEAPGCCGSRSSW